MAFDRVAAVARSRRVVHSTHALAVTYSDDVVVVPVSLTIGLFNRINLQGNLVEAGYADIIEGVNRIRFNSEELAEKSITPKVGGVVTLTDPLMMGAVFNLENLEPSTGPINVVWGVSKK